MGSQANLLARISADATPFARAIGEVNTALDKAFQKAGASTRGFQALGASLSSFGSTLTLGVTAPVLAFGAATIKAASDLDSLKRGLAAVAGSSAAAEKQFKDLREVAKLPGLGLTDAVRGSINLQALGFSAQKSQQILQTFGNALATVGRGKEDLGETIRQLGQLGARGKVTADNLRPIIERIPQLAGIIKTNFGPDALGDPAKTFEKLGIDSAKFIDIVIGELGKLPPVTGGAKNAIENLRDAIEISAGRIGEKFLPAVERILPKLEEMATAAGDAADAFTSLPAPIQNVTLALAGLAIASGPIAAVTGRLIAATTAIKAFGAALGIFGTAVPAAAKVANAYFLVGGSAKAATVAVGGLSAAAVGGAAAAGVAVAGLLTPLLSTQTALENQEKAAAKAKATLEGYGRAIGEQVQPLLAKLEPNTQAAYEGLLTFSRGLGVAKKAAEEVKPPLKTVTEKVNVLAEATKTLGITLSGDAVAAFAVARKAFETISKAYEDGKVSTIDLTRAQESLGEAYGKLISGLGAVPPQVAKVADAFDFARERALLAIGDIQLAAAGARNIALGGLIGPARDTNPTILDGSDAAKSSQRNLDLIRRTAQGAQGAWTTARTNISRQVSTIVTDFGRAVSDIITKSSSVGEAFSRLGKSIVDSLIRGGIEIAVNQGIKLLGKLLNSIGGVGKSIGGILTGGGGGGGFGGGGGSAGVGGAVGSLAGAAVSGVVGAVSGVVSAISGVISNFQFAAMNKTLDLIEHQVRYSQIHLLYILEKLNKHLPGLDDINQRLIEFRQLGVKIEGGGAGTTVNITVQGSLVGGPNVAAELSAMVVRNLKLQGV